MTFHDAFCLAVPLLMVAPYLYIFSTDLNR